MLELSHRSPARCLGLFLVCLSLSFFLTSDNAKGDQDLPREQLPSSWKQDAELTDVFFLDSLRGWAVGAQGVIIRTTDGGTTWNEISQVPGVTSNNLSLDQKFRNMRNGIQSRATGLANSSSAHHPMTCRFESVFFVNEKQGWVAGGYDVPYVGRSRAVLMRTQDGGVSWNPVKNLVIPRLRKIHFKDRLNGWAIGKTGNLYPEGIFYTSDGGISWSSRSSDRNTAWIDAAPIMNGFITINASGRLGVIRSNRYEPAVILGDEPANVRCLKMVDEQHGWAAGDAGTLLKTTNGGLSWSPVKIPGHSGSTRGYDFLTAELSGNQLWLAGDPGTTLYRLDVVNDVADSVRLPTNVRINQICFADPLNGWAVGARGSVMATSDGGQSWRIQRGGSQRTAILCVSTDSATLPFEILSKYANEENQVCASLILGDSGDPETAAVQATERLGSTTLFRLNASDHAVQDSADRQRVLEKFVRVIRSLQPNVIVLNSTNKNGSSHQNALFDPILVTQDAIRMAADGGAFAHQMDLSAMKTWQVDRLAVRDPSGSVTVDPGRLLPRNGVLIEDQISLSRALVGQSVLQESAAQYRVTHCTNRDRMEAGDLLSGLDPRKRVPPRGDDGVRRGNLGMIQQANAKQKTFERFVRFDAKNPQDLLVWRQQVQSFSIKMDQDVAGVWLMQLVERYLKAGKTQLAANTATLLVTHWGNHAFAPASLTWLAHYYASEEFAQIELNHLSLWDNLGPGESPSQATRIRKSFMTSPKTIQASGSSHLVWVPTQAMIDAELTEGDGDSTFVAPASSTEADSQPELANERLKLASRFLMQLSQQDPDLAAGPQHQLLEAQLSRRLNGILATEGRYKGLVQRRHFEGAGVSTGAQRELAIAGRLPPSADPIPMFACFPTDARPRLDGTLDESIWKLAVAQGNAITPRAQSLNGRPSLENDSVMFAYDDEFLYVGFHCHKLDGQYYPARNPSMVQPRTRDADLERRDRVELVLDVDRDYRSAARFIIDHRGWVRETSGGCLGWNPDWFVSQSENESSWTVELAIPLDAIVPSGIQPETIWAIQLARRGFHSHNLWQTSIGPDADGDRAQRQGIRMGLESRPSDFELLRFHVPSTETTTSPVVQQIQ